MVKSVICFFAAIFMAVSLHAQTEEDFVGLLMSNLSESAGAESDEYQCTSVSPSMMEKMLQVMQTRSNENIETIKRLLPHIKSMRIFTACKHIDQYQDQTLKLLAEKSKSYKSFSRDAKSVQSPSVWLRRCGKKVVEMIVLSRKGNQNFNVINLTGDMDKAFVNDLLKM